MNFKKPLLLTLMLCLMSSQLFAASIPIYFEQKLIDSNETPAYISSSRTFIPVRAVGNVLNLNVDWQSPDVILSGKHLTTGKYLTVSINSKTHSAVLNGRTLTQCIEVKQGRSYITLRVLAEAFGYVVDWKNKSVYISLPAANTSETTPQTSFENEVLRLINIERSKENLPALLVSEDLRAAARLKSSDMQKNNYFNHTSPSYGSPFEMLSSLGISYQAAAENIAYGYQTPEAVVNGWMNSPGHRTNILNQTYTHIGIGYNPAGHYWTQLFIKPY